MAREVSLTEDGNVSLGLIEFKKQGACVIVRAASDLGSGTLSIQTRPGGSSGVKESLAELASGESGTYTVGEGMELFANLTGSTDPDVAIIVSQY